MSSSLAKLILLGILIGCAASQSISLIGNTVTISWINKGDVTSFYATAAIGNGVVVSDAWLGIGLNPQSTMVCLFIFLEQTLEIAFYLNFRVVLLFPYVVLVHRPLWREQRQLLRRE